jgi:predicted cupin superfamily sugar epimerase
MKGKHTLQNARYWIETLKLLPHPEGGFYRETYRANLKLPHAALPKTFGGDRSACTAIYFLLEGDHFSAFHRIAADEMWHFYAGSTLAVHEIDAEGEHIETRLGASPERGDVFQFVVPAGRWFASCLADPEGFALVGCTVAPGFDFAEFEIAERTALAARYPRHKSVIERLTR